MTVSIETQKAFEKIQYLFMTETFNKLGIDNFYHPIKGIHEKPTTMKTL